MSGDRYDADVSEEASLAGFDDGLKAALSVAPSPDFEARVLRRIAGRSTAGNRRSMVSAPLAAAAVVAIAAALVVQRPDQSRDLPIAPSQAASKWAPPGPDPRVAVSPVRPATPPAATRLADRPRRAVPGAVRKASRPPSAGGTSEPEVIVEPGQAEAIRRLVRAIAEGTIEPPPIPQRGAGAPAPVPVQPLTIEPILVSAAEDRGGPPPVVRPH